MNSRNGCLTVQEAAKSQIKAKADLVTGDAPILTDGSFYVCLQVAERINEFSWASFQKGTKPLPEGSALENALPPHPPHWEVGCFST